MPSERDADFISDVREAVSLMRQGMSRKLETETRQQYRTKFVNSVYEICMIASTDDGWCMLVSVQWLPPSPPSPHDATDFTNRNVCHFVIIN